MTRDTYVRWTCNSCGAVEDVTGGQPKGWVGYGMTQPGVPAGEQTTLGHLCNTCAQRLEAALAARDSDDRAAR